MDVTVTGDVLNLSTSSTSAFTAHFDITEGRVINAPCGSTTVVNVTNFSASVDNLRVGSTPIVAPHDFTAYLASVNCGTTYQELVGGSMFSLEVQGEKLFSPNAALINGNLGSWWIEGGRVQISAPEPCTVALLALGVAAVLARSWFTRASHCAA